MDWNFKISTGLKNLIGRELITNEFIAIFELVKNSYDAGAKKVIIKFENIYAENSRILISDDGHGMNSTDIQEKWLFVAYSEKTEGKRAGTYRDNFSERVYAGAKGVGRFSCDRLGEKLKLFSQKKGESTVNYIDINWSQFEIDSKEEFIHVPVKHGTCLKLPSGFSYGTTIEISNLRSNWDREALLELKKSLSKMVNPDAELSKDDQFNIYIECEEELENDEIERKRLEQLEEKIAASGQKIVNGIITNYVFETLNIKTTQIIVEISEDGETKYIVVGTTGTEVTGSRKYVKDADGNYIIIRNNEFWAYVDGTDHAPVYYDGNYYEYDSDQDGNRGDLIEQDTSLDTLPDDMKLNF